MNILEKKPEQDILLVRKSYHGGPIMGKYMSDVTALSSKGQIVLPKAIRDSLNINSGTKLMVFSDGENILLKPIPVPDINEFQGLMNAAAEWADQVGLSEGDIVDAIKTVRNRRKKQWSK